MNSLHRDPFHSNPGNWVCGFIYFCKDDPRIIVPKRLRGLGWTLNFARPFALPVLLLLVGVAILPFALLNELHVYSQTWWFLTRVLLVTGIIWTCIRLSLPPKR